MFDTSDASLLGAMAAAQRDERMATARRMLLTGRLVQRRTVGLSGLDRTQWCIDNWEAVAAEIGAELGVSRGRASSQMNYGIELLERLPKLGAAFAAGAIDVRVIMAAVFRTGLITDPAILARIDEVLARCAPQWNRLSGKRLAEIIDHWVSDLDPAARRTAGRATGDRHIDFGESRDGMVEFWGALRAPEAAALQRTLETLADSVCPDDPRTKDQRRADALTALAGAGPTGAGPTGAGPTMGCDCEQPDCPSAMNTSPGAVVIHLIADSATLSGQGHTPGYLPGYGVIPPPMLREIAQQATLRPLDPSALSCPEGRYRPSAALAEFIRCRDVHCRFPGCDKPAEYCDIDHTIPWQAGGPTHPSNLALLCRAHHLLKTFWTGQSGWAETQSGNGTITWTSPSGRIYTTNPTGALLFPRLAAPTGQARLENRQASNGPGRTLMMPTRTRTREQQRAARIQWERGLNQARLNQTRLNQTRWAADPPPF